MTQWDLPLQTQGSHKAELFMGRRPSNAPQARQKPPSTGQNASTVEIICMTKIPQNI